MQLPSLRTGGGRCKRCGYALEGSPDACPQCHFSPKARGLRVSMGFLLGVVVSITLLMFVPQFASVLIPAAGLSFLLCILVFFVSFVATPHRLGSLFLRP